MKSCLIKNTHLAFVLLMFSLTVSSCKDKTDDPPIVDPTLNQVIGANNNWMILGQAHTKNKSNTGLHSYTIGGEVSNGRLVSIDQNNRLHFLLGESFQIGGVWNNNMFVGHVDLTGKNKVIEPLTNFDNTHFYSFKPNSSEVLSGWLGYLIGSTVNYHNNHPLLSGYTSGITRMDDKGNIYTTSYVTGAEQWVFLRRAGSDIDSFYSVGTGSGIYSGMYPAVLKNGKCYAIVKSGKTMIALVADESKYNGRGEFKVIKEIPCLTFTDDITARFIAKTSPDGRYIYYWLCEAFSDLSRGWCFSFDCETEEFSFILNNIVLKKGAHLDQTGISKTAAIGDDGALYLAGPEDPNKSGDLCKIYKIAFDPNATHAVQYKSDNFLQKDKFGNAYQVDYMQFVHGKLILGVASGKVIGEDPQMDIIIEK